MSDDLWIVVPNWDKFQHYPNRDPVWIKVYTELVHNDDFLELSLADRGLLMTLWVLYARTLGQLRSSRVPDFLPARYPRRHFLDSLASLNHAGFIRLSASKPLALARSREKRREDKKEPGAHAQKKPRPKPAVEGRINAAAYELGNARAPDPAPVDLDALELAKRWLTT